MNNESKSPINHLAVISCFLNKSLSKICINYICMYVVIREYYILGYIQIMRLEHQFKWEIRRACQHCFEHESGFSTQSQFRTWICHTIDDITLKFSRALFCCVSPMCISRINGTILLAYIWYRWAESREFDKISFLNQIIEFRFSGVWL